LFPAAEIVRSRETDAGPLLGAGDVPIHRLVFVNEQRTISGDVVALPGLRIGRKHFALWDPSLAVVRTGETGVPGVAVEAGIEIHQDMVVQADYGGVQHVDGLPSLGAPVDGIGLGLEAEGEIGIASGLFWEGE